MPEDFAKAPTSRDPRPDWLEELGPFACFGQQWTVRTSDPVLSELIADLYRPLLCPPAQRSAECVRFDVTPCGEGRPGRVERDGVLSGTRPTPHLLFRHFMWAVNRLVIGGSVDHVTLHAAAAVMDDVAVMLPAQMEAGKTTLVTGLLDRGAGYLTDEAVALSADLEVIGYPKPLSIDAGAWPVLPHHQPQGDPALLAYHAGQWQVPPARFTEVHASAPLGLIVFPTYQPGARTRIERLRPMAALERAFPCTFPDEEEQPPPAWKVRRLAAAVTSVPSYALVSADLDEACAAIKGVMQHPPQDHQATPPGGRGP